MEKPLVMGIINCTPDSFFAESRISIEDTILPRAKKMITEGADILDIGGYSSRPGAVDVSISEEMNRVIPTIETIRKYFPDVIISIDSFRSEVIEAAVGVGANIVNDISGGRLDEKLFETVGKLGCPYILMHSKGTPQTMHHETNYELIFNEMSAYFSRKIEQLRTYGVKDIILDPGFGFAKTTAQNFEIMNRLEDFQVFGLPILAGISRKSMISKTLNVSTEKTLNGTTVLNTIALMKGASILRVHDVKEAVEVVKLITPTQLPYSEL